MHAGIQFDLEKRKSGNLSAKSRALLQVYEESDKVAR